jgi:hypothetical protein
MKCPKCSAAQMPIVALRRKARFDAGQLAYNANSFCHQNLVSQVCPSQGHSRKEAPIQPSAESGLRLSVTTYTVVIQHDDDGELNVQITDAGHSESDRASIAHALREAARMVENGLPIERGMFS